MLTFHLAGRGQAIIFTWCLLSLALVKLRNVPFSAAHVPCGRDGLEL